MRVIALSDGDMGGSVTVTSHVKEGYGTSRRLCPCEGEQYPPASPVSM
jgi:hypothetical protein